MNKTTEKADRYISGFDDWRGELLGKLREIILEADPELAEEWKWNSPVWSKNGLVCSIGAFKTHVGMHFFQGAFLKDPHGLINNSLSSKEARSIKWTKDDPVRESELKKLIHEAIHHNLTK